VSGRSRSRRPWRSPRLARCWNACARPRRPPNATGREREELTELGRTLERAVAAEDVIGYSNLVQDIHRLIREMARQDTVAAPLVSAHLRARRD
jgi:DNA-binding GntR family transcriptional regulator